MPRSRVCLMAPNQFSFSCCLPVINRQRQVISESRSHKAAPYLPSCQFLGNESGINDYLHKGTMQKSGKQAGSGVAAPRSNGE